MGHVLCAVDSPPVAAAAAIAHCRERGSALGLVGIVREPREFGALQHRLVQTARAARGEGVEPSIVTRAGEPLAALLREAEETGADELFLPEPRRSCAARAASSTFECGSRRGAAPEVLRLAA
ncbi:MAG: hypothetical protein ACRDNC_12960 [Gaiellaceae bacterium]